MSTPASLYEIDLVIIFSHGFTQMTQIRKYSSSFLIRVHLCKSVAHFCSVFLGRGGGPKSPYAMKPERDESSFCAMRPVHISSGVSFVAVIFMSSVLPRV